MKTISLKSEETYTENSTSKYWRSVKCSPQTVELKTWSIGEPFFILKGIVTNSHDEKEIGTERDFYIQTYSFFLEAQVNEGKYTIN